MTYVIALPCVDVKDRSCIEECPVDCIYEGDRMLYIHPGECVDCGACEPVCPVEAIYYEDDLPAQWVDYTTINAEFFTDLGSPGGAAKTGALPYDHPSVAGLPLRALPEQPLLPPDPESIGAPDEQLCGARQAELMAAAGRGHREGIAPALPGRGQRPTALDQIVWSRSTACWHNCPSLPRRSQGTPPFRTDDAYQPATPSERRRQRVHVQLEKVDRRPAGAAEALGGGHHSSTCH